jgi:beta-fructofuranosidase
MPLSDCALPYEEAWSVGHAVSDDLLHWRQCPSVLPPLRDNGNPDDFDFKFTGCAAEKDGKYFLFYTMRDKERASQRIGVALSDDGYNWEIHDKNPVIEPDPSIFIGYTGRTCDWGIVDCRDMLVVQNPADGLYYGYFAAAADVGRRSPVGVIGVAVSTDLLNWEQQSIVYVPRSNGAIEVPDVYCIDGKWYLTMLAGTNYCGRSVTDDEYVTNCTIYAVADNPRGPFVEPSDNIFIGGINMSGCSCRTIEKDGTRYLLYTDRAVGVYTLSLPKEVRLDDEGNPGVYWSEIVAELRREQLIAPCDLPEIQEMPYTSFAWKTTGGSYTERDGKYWAQTADCDWQAAGFGVGAASIEYNVDITLHGATAAGLWVASKEEGKCHNYLFMLEPDKQRVLATSFYGFEYYAARKHPFMQDTTYSLKLVMIEGVCELYIDGKLLLQCGIEMFAENHVGLFCDRGEAEFGNISLYALES